MTGTEYMNIWKYSLMLAQEVLEPKTICRRLRENIQAPALGHSRREDTQRDGPLI